MNRRPGRWLAPAIVLPVAVLIGVLLRLAPCLRDPGFDLVVDAGGYERLTRTIVTTGRLPAVDPLSNAPQGRAVARHLPTGLFESGAFAHRVLSAFGSRSLRWNLALLVALAGALIALPVWIGARAVSGDAGTAGLAALLSVFLPAHLQRSAGFYYRFDGPGTLLAALHVALALACLGEARPVRRRMLAAGSALALVAALWLWRVSLVVFAADLAFGLLWLVVRGAGPALRDLWLAIVLAGAPAMLLIPYLRAHGILLSPLGLGATGLAVLLCLPPLRAGGRWPPRLAAAAALALLAMVVPRHGTPADYTGLPAMLAARLGLSGGHDPIAALMLDVQELRGTAPGEFLLGHRLFSVLGTWLAVSPALLWWLAGRPSARRMLEAGAAPALLAVVTATLVALTLAFERTSVLLAPFAAMTLGALAARLPGAATPAAAASARSARRERSRAARSDPGAGAAGRRALGAALAASAVAAVAAGVFEAATSWSHLDRNERAALDFLRAHAARGAIVLSDWDAGYDVQNVTGLPTVVDGLTESTENRRRILELDTALMERAPDALERLCVRYGARWLLVPPGSAIHGMAVVTGDPLAGMLERGEPVRPGPLTDHVIVHLVANDLDYPAFRRAFTAGPFQVYEVVPASHR